MKKYIVIGLIVLVGGALLIVPLLKEDPEDPDSDSNPTEQVQDLPAQFAFPQNLALKCNLGQTIEVAVKKKDIALLEVYFDGNVVQKWDNPIGNVSFPFTGMNVGTYTFELIGTMKNGEQFKDERFVQVVAEFPPKRLTATIVDTYPHNDRSFTQGLEFNGGKLFEGVGLKGESKIMEVNLETGDINRKLGLDGTYFGEGITLLNNKLYQLTWQNGKCFIYDYQDESFMLVDEKTYVGEGWGLCNNGTELIMSDGSEVICFRDPETFQEIRRIQVFNDVGPIPQLNELEYFDGKIYANVYQTNLVVSIDPETGKVIEMINCNVLAAKGRGSGLELNGIAKNDVDGKIYMTGKNWPLLFEVSFVPEAIP